MKQTLREPYKQFFGTLANQTRIDIIEALQEKPQTISELAQKTKLEQSQISHNLKRLVECGFVTTEQNGREKTCTLNTTTIQPLLALMNKHMHNYCAHVVKVKKCN